MRPITVAIEARDGKARAAVARTARGSFRTPCFMPVGTRGAVKLLDSADLDALSPEVVLANAYHLMLRPGADVVSTLGGLHRFSGWNGHILTDSGGYQVFSLKPRVDEDGVDFRSVYDGSRHRLTPEGAVALQEALGADVQMALDVCCPLPASRQTVVDAAERTLAWAKRAREAHRDPCQSLFGIVQGGVDGELRANCARLTVDCEFDGYAVGGLSVGEPRAEMLPALAAALEFLPEDRPRYLMGVGDPVSMVEAVSMGVDMFDCVLPTRLARHGSAISREGRYQLKAARFARDEAPVDEECRCVVCSRYSRAYLRHLLTVGEPTGGRLLTIHNVAWLLRLVEEIREAIVAGTLESMRKRVADSWGGDSEGRGPCGNVLRPLDAAGHKHMHTLHSLIIQAATTSTTTGKSKSSGGQYTFLILIAILAVVYLFFIRPRQQRARQQQRSAKELGIGDPVMSAGGIYGTVVGLGTDDVDVEVSPGIILTFTRRAISVRPGAQSKSAPVDDDSIPDPEDDPDSGQEDLEPEDYDAEDYDDGEEPDDESHDHSDPDDEGSDDHEATGSAPEEDTDGANEPEEDVTTAASDGPSPQPSPTSQPAEGDIPGADGTSDRRNGRRGKRR